VQFDGVVVPPASESELCVRFARLVEDSVRERVRQRGAVTLVRPGSKSKADYRLVVFVAHARQSWVPSSGEKGEHSRLEFAGAMVLTQQSPEGVQLVWPFPGSPNDAFVSRADVGVDGDALAYHAASVATAIMIDLGLQTFESVAATLPAGE